MKLVTFNLILIGTIFTICSQAQTQNHSLDFITPQEFYQQLGSAKSYINIKNIDVQKNPLLMIFRSKNDLLNTKYSLDNDTYFETDTDNLILKSNETNLVDARKELFQNIPFPKENGNFLFPYPILTHWDLLPHPPIQNLVHDKSYYSNEFNEDHIGENPDLLSNDFQKELSSLTNSDLTYNNKLEILDNGHVITELMMLLRDTKSFVLASNMFITCDSSLDPLLNLMKLKIKEGVEIHLILERVFAIRYSKCFKKIKKLGVHVTYSKEMIKLKNRYVYHNKFWIFDNKKAVVYGANLLDTEVESTGFNNRLRDSGIKVEGPMVTQLSEDYLKIRKYIKGKKSKKIQEIEKMVNAQIIEDQKSKSRGLENLPLKSKSELSGMCRVVFQGPHQKNKTAVSDLYQKLVEKAKNSVYVTSTRIPSLELLKKDVRSLKILETLYNKTQQDKDFRADIMTNNYLDVTDVKSINYKKTGFLVGLYKMFARSENNLKAIFSTREYFRRPDRSPNFNIWNYFNYYHAKNMLVDNTLSIIGSFNMNRNSNERSFEMALVCYDPKAINEMQNGIILDLINAIPILE